MYARGMGLVGILTTIMGAGTFYVVSTGRWPFLAIVPFWVFMLILLGILTLFMVFAYMVITPSLIAFNNKQACEHGNPIMDKLLELEKILKELQLKNGNQK